MFVKSVRRITGVSSCVVIGHKSIGTTKPSIVQIKITLINNPCYSTYGFINKSIVWAINKPYDPFYMHRTKTLHMKYTKTIGLTIEHDYTDRHLFSI